MRRTVALVVATALAACSSPPERVATPAPQRTTAVSETPTAPGGRTRPDPAAPRPEWLGQRVLPLRADGLGEIRPTPPILRDRRLETIDLLPVPGTDAFRANVERVPKDVLARSTWSTKCPVARADLAYVTVAFWGFDREVHTGELLVHRSVARDVVFVMEKLHGARFPIEEMRITTRAELDALPTGDGNNTGAFVCRPSVRSTTWSEHAYGLAIDVNPFHNPYVADDVVIPELASAYARRSWRRPGMILEGSVVEQAFASIGWEWGGAWTSSKDYMHFSQEGR
ncbi:MAG TPA: M15 family metallopeptidase [Actinomycetota bacterium]|nr:M15 family metallopeptidase [Actinomycetota bacterium]